MVHLLLAVIYLAFISLGLPDALLGSAWPSMYPQFSVPMSYAGIISLIVSAGTVVSSLVSDRLTRKLGAGGVTALSVALTAAALFGFSVSRSFWMLCLLAVPYGLGAGSVDAALNNYVALHYGSHHMSWLHCMWGVGATLGPYVMSYAMTGGRGWSGGYRIIALLQAGLTLIVLLSLPLWKKRPNAQEAETKPLTLRQTLSIPGAKEILTAFFCYCALEQTTGLWAASYLVLHTGLTEERAAAFAGLFFLGITAGRAVSGFLTFRLSDAAMIRLGCGIIAAGVAALLLPFGWAAPAAFVLIGLGCAPVYPCIIHSTPAHFGAERSQALIGMQMACAYVGVCAMPPLFGLIANHITVALLPGYLAVLLVVMAVMHECVLKKCSATPQHS